MGAVTMFVIRPAGLFPNDADFFIATFDATIEHLKSIGHEGQWGTTPFSQKEGFIETTKQDVVQSERFRKTKDGERLLLWIAENTNVDEPIVHQDGQFGRLDDNRQPRLSVGAAMIRDNQVPEHIHALPDIHKTISEAESRGYIFLDVLMAYYGALPEHRKGSGSALINHAKRYAIEHEKSTIFVEVWTGGNKRLLE